MKNSTSWRIKGCRPILQLLVASLLATGGCKREEAEKAVASPPTKPDVASAEKTSFKQVTSQLDEGGSVYAYLSTSQWLEGLSGQLKGWRDLVASIPDASASARTNVHRGFDAASSIIQRSGMEQLSGVGLSGIALEKGLYQTKFVIQRNTLQPHGGMWTMFGKAPRPLHELDWLPATTAWAGFSDCDFTQIWEAVSLLIKESGIEELQAGFKEVSGAVQTATGKELGQLVNSLGGNAGAFLTLDNERKITIPLPTGKSLDVPEPGLVITIKVKDDSLFALIDQHLQRHSEVIRKDEGDLHMRTLPIPLPLPVQVRPTVAQQGGYLFLASNDSLIKSVLAVKAGSQPGLKSTDEFKRLAKGMPSEGNSLFFMSQSAGEVGQKVQRAFAKASQPDSEAATAFLEKVYSGSQPGSSFVVGQSTPSGWFTVAHGQQHPANAVLLPLVVAPVAVIAGLTLPALSKAKGKAQSISCVNNLKQLGLAARIYSSEHKDKFPPNVLAMKLEMGTPKILICPADTSHPASSFTGWDDFDVSWSSYEHVTPNLSESVEGFAEKILFRCKIHGHVCKADGSVVQNPQRK